MRLKDEMDRTKAGQSEQWRLLLVGRTLQVAMAGAAAGRYDYRGRKSSWAPTDYFCGRCCSGSRFGSRLVMLLY